MKRSTRASAYYFTGLEDRENKMPCRSANGNYLNGWYEMPPDGHVMNHDVHVQKQRIVHELNS